MAPLIFFFFLTLMLSLHDRFFNDVMYIQEFTIFFLKAEQKKK